MFAGDKTSEVPHWIPRKQRKPLIPSWSETHRLFYLRATSAIIGAGAAYETTKVLNTFNKLLIGQLFPDNLEFLSRFEPTGLGLSVLGGALAGYTVYEIARRHNTTS